MTNYIWTLISLRPSLLPNKLFNSYLTFLLFGTISCFKLYNAVSWFYLFMDSSQCPSYNLFPFLDPSVLLIIHVSFVCPIFLFFIFLFFFVIYFPVYSLTVSVRAGRFVSCIVLGTSYPTQVWFFVFLTEEW